MATWEVLSRTTDTAGETTTWLVDVGTPQEQDRIRDDDQDDDDTGRRGEGLMGRRLVVQVVLDEGQGDDVYDQLAQVVCAARGVVGWSVVRCTGDRQEQDSFGCPLDGAHAALSAAWEALDATREAGRHWDACAEHVSMAIERVEQAQTLLDAARREDAELEAVRA
jgi:hypothetical protein